MPEKEEEGFSFVDKRRVSREETPDAPADSAPIDEGVPADLEDSEDAVPEDFDPRSMGLPQLSVKDRIFMSIDILHQGAWIAMGLRADPATGEIEQNLDAARLAIDCVTFLASKIEDELDDATRRELKRIVSDMQMNYVNQVQRAAQ